jgi:hypothetical protein
MMAMEKKRDQDILAEIALIKGFGQEISGQGSKSDKIAPMRLLRVNGALVFQFDDIIDEKFKKEPVFTMTSGDDVWRLSGRTTAHRTSVKKGKGRATRYTEGKVDEIRSDWSSGKGHYRSYYHCGRKNLLYHFFGRKRVLSLVFGEDVLTVEEEEEYLLISSTTVLTYQRFNDLSYPILVAMGFITGEFLQEEVFTFKAGTQMRFLYHTLRKGSSSIYHALLWNPYGYEGMIGRPYAEKLYKQNTLKPLDPETFTRLAKLVLDDHHFKYALVLFNDANANTQSLLIRNNCFFAVIEVLRKNFFEAHKTKLPNAYFNAGNMDKMKMVFQQVIAISADEMKTLNLRNSFAHGDVKNIEGTEMMAIMMKQISLIYKLVLSFVGFDGHVIDHYHLRYGPAKKAYVNLTDIRPVSNIPTS